LRYDRSAQYGSTAREQRYYEEVSVHVDAILCNHAEAVNNLLYVSGGGINACNFPPGAPPPYGINVGLGMLITVPWTQTNQQHKVQVQLHSEDGEEVALPTGAGSTEPLRLEIAFNVGRPPVIQPGDDQVVALATNLNALPLPAVGKYEFVISVDGSPERRLGLRLQPEPGGQLTFR
jgi:hypothetical protein